MPWVTSAMKRVGLVVFFHALAIFLRPKKSGGSAGETTDVQRNGFATGIEFFATCLYA